jgi:rubrerythrin
MADWSLDEVPLDKVDRAAVAHREDLFYLVTAASFIEIASDLYTHNLVAYFDDDPEIRGWLEQRWEHEEMRHGRVLRAYAQHAWPEFDWERAYAGFLAEYSQQCTVEAFEPTRCLELAARCVIETGTATYYESLASQSAEPVLQGIATRIRADEINHYKHFYRYFRTYRARENQGRLPVLRALVRRVAEVRDSDAECALRHVHAVRHPSATNASAHTLYTHMAAQMRHHYPLDMAVKMILKPLELPARISQAVQAPLLWAGRKWLMN